MGRQHLDGHVPIEGGIERQIYDGHSADTQLPLDAIPAEGIPFERDADRFPHRFHHRRTRWHAVKFHLGDDRLDPRFLGRLVPRIDPLYEPDLDDHAGYSAHNQDRVQKQAH